MNLIHAKAATTGKRQSFLDWFVREKDFSYALTDLGSEYVNLPADERRQLLAGIAGTFSTNARDFRIVCEG